MTSRNEPASCQIEELGHTSEIGFHVDAPTLAWLFTCAAVALFQIMRPGRSQEGPPIEREITLETTDIEALLIDWLNELLFLFETTHAVYETEVHEVSATGLRATGYGRRPVHPPDVHIKAVTYHQLEVRQTPRGWAARVYVDI